MSKRSKLPRDIREVVPILALELASVIGIMGRTYRVDGPVQVLGESSQDVVELFGYEEHVADARLKCGQVQLERPAGGWGIMLRFCCFLILYISCTRKCGIGDFGNSEDDDDDVETFYIRQIEIIPILSNTPSSRIAPLGVCVRGNW